MRDDRLRLTSCFAQGLLQPPTSAGSPFPLSRAPWQKFSVEVRGFEPVTLLREMYLLTTSPSGRAQICGDCERGLDSDPQAVKSDEEYSEFGLLAEQVPVGTAQA